MANHRCVKLCNAKGQYTENTMANVRMSRIVFTDFYTQSWCSGSSRLVHWYPLPFVGLLVFFNCSTWCFIMALTARHATMIVKTALASPFIGDITCRKSWKIKLFQKPVGRIAVIFHWPYFCVILLFFTKALHLRKSFSLLFIRDLNIASLFERSVTAAIHVSHLPQLFSNVDKIC